MNNGTQTHTLLFSHKHSRMFSAAPTHRHTHTLLAGLIPYDFFFSQCSQTQTLTHTRRSHSRSHLFGFVFCLKHNPTLLHSLLSSLLISVLCFLCSRSRPKETLHSLHSLSCSCVLGISTCLRHIPINLPQAFQPDGSLGNKSHTSVNKRY